MKRNWTKPVVAVVALSLVAAACGDDDEPAADEPTEEPADAGDTTDTTAAGGEAGGESLLDGAIPCENQYEGKTVSVFSPVRDSENDTPVADYVGGYDPLMECTPRPA
ncbi:MAG: hypothetical protein R2697_12010 [Ilumatobacteraceae bacterium]